MAEVTTMQQFTEPSAADERPQINSVKDLCYSGSARGTTTTRTPKGTKVVTQVCYYFACFVDDDDVAYNAHVQQDIDWTLELLRERLKRIPDKDVYPEKPPNLTIFSLPTSEGLHKKRPELSSWDQVHKDLMGEDYLARLFLGEVEVFEVLHRNPHPNIVRYHGCTVNSKGRVTAILMDEHPMTLSQRLESERRHDFDKTSCFQGIESAIKHLHSLGLAHNDLNPYNILVDKDDRPIVIDFGSCGPFGACLLSGGTKGWVSEEDTKFIASYLSEKRHDDFALEKIWAWMEEKTALK